MQRRYYRDTAAKYNKSHVYGKDEHYLALSVMLGVVDFLEVTSILDIGSGTGRAIIQTKRARPDMLVRGIEPVRELREVAYSEGISEVELTDGDALDMEFSDGEFDVVCAFGVMHHVRHPNEVVEEMLRVAKKAIFISDSNSFGQGSLLARTIKQLINTCGLWSVANLIKTRGRGYTVSQEEGLSYSYSVFNNYKQIRQCCKSVHVFNTTPGGVTPYRTASHVALLGIKG
jgi:ubiquinone/menaquinone biosynthesis C-methylase UbiE